jgi:hypothetical protein
MPQKCIAQTASLLCFTVATPLLISCHAIGLLIGGLMPHRMNETQCHPAGSRARRAAHQRLLWQPRRWQSHLPARTRRTHVRFECSQSTPHGLRLLSTHMRSGGTLGKRWLTLAATARCNSGSEAGLARKVRTMSKTRMLARPERRTAHPTTDTPSSAEQKAMGAKACGVEQHTGDVACKRIVESAIILACQHCSTRACSFTGVGNG